MKNIIYLLLALFVATAAALFFREALVEQGDPGYVLISYGTWSVETSLFVFVALGLIGFFVLYIVQRVLRGVFGISGHLKSRREDRKSARSKQALVEGLIDLADGNWEKAEKGLIRHAADSGTALVHYLAAAKAAQAQGTFETRDEYLGLAYESTPGSQFAVGLTQVEMQLSHKQFDEALESLSALNSIAPTHATVLKLLHQTYDALEDWESIRKLIPSLHENKVLMEAEIKGIETDTYTALLKNKAKQGDANELSALWESIPAHIKGVSNVQSLYFSAMIEAGSGLEIEETVREFLKKGWSDTLVVLYGCIKMEKSSKQLRLAEKWLKKRPNDSVLLRVLGKLSLRSENLEKAEKYLGDSIGVEPTVEAYQLLGDLMLQKDDKERASGYYRQGLMLASEEIVKNIDHVPSTVEDFGGKEQQPPLALAN